MARKRLKPQEGYKLAKPEGGWLHPEGEVVEMSEYWRRRLRTGEAVEVPKKSKARVAQPTAGQGVTDGLVQRNS